jgi:N-acetylglutamate synthase
MVYFSIMATSSYMTANAGLGPEDILLIETLAANAWPPERSVVLDGWRLRSAGGVTRRANSVWPNADTGGASLEDKLAAVERHYAALGQPSIFQICDAARPANLDAALAARGYGANSHTFVQTAPIRDLLQNLPPLRLYPHFEIEVSEEFYDEWFAFYCHSEEVSGYAATMRRGILRRIQPTHGFALLRINGEPAAVGLGVAEAGWLGIFNMATLPEFRRQGAAGAILRTLAIWGQLYDAQQAYLQVMKNNPAAQQLYAGAGFATAYHYYYREKRSQ